MSIEVSESIRPKRMGFLEGCRNAVGEMGVGQAVVVGVTDGFLSAACFVGHPKTETVARVLDYAVVDPIGVVLGAFSLSVLTHAARTVVKH